MHAHVHAHTYVHTPTHIKLTGLSRCRFPHMESDEFRFKKNMSQVETGAREHTYVQPREYKPVSI